MSIFLFGNLKQLSKQRHQMVESWNKCSKAATLTRKYHLTQREKDKNNEKSIYSYINILVSF